MMALWLLLMSVAQGQDEICKGDYRAPPESLSVAWVSPLRAKVGAQGWIRVVRTQDLRAWAEAETGSGLGRMLQSLGLRRTDRDPRRRYKVTIFDVASTGLCRPLAGYDDPVAIDGMVTCPARLSKVTRSYAGCGFTLDRATGEAGLELYSARWNDVARNGFCVLPADRFLLGLRGG
jgi:hypothetical protein